MAATCLTGPFARFRLQFPLLNPQPQRRGSVAINGAAGLRFRIIATIVLTEAHRP